MTAKRTFRVVVHAAGRDVVVDRPTTPEAARQSCVESRRKFPRAQYVEAYAENVRLVRLNRE